MVRFLALLRIKPHAPPLVRAPVNSFGVLALRSSSPGGVLNAFATTEGRKPPTPSTHRLQRETTRVSTDSCSLPHAFGSSASVTDPENRLRHWCSSWYLAHFTATQEFHSPTSALVRISAEFQMTRARLSRAAFTSRLNETTCARFTPNNSGQRLPPTYYRGCWHVVSRGFFWLDTVTGERSTLILVLLEQSVLQSEDLPPSRGVARVDFRPLPKIPYCCLP